MSFASVANLLGGAGGASSGLSVKHPYLDVIPTNTSVDVEENAPTVLRTIALPANLQNAQYYQIRVRGGSWQYTQADGVDDTFIMYWTNQQNGSGVDGTETIISLDNFTNLSTLQFNTPLVYSGPVNPDSPKSISTNEISFDYYPPVDANGNVLPTSTLYWILSYDGGYPAQGLGNSTFVGGSDIFITAVF
jgi:hypothetical protein